VEPYHALYMRDEQRKTEEKLLAYNRHVTALWSPDGKGLAINDYGGSDYSNCFVFSFDGEHKKVDIRQELEQLLAASDSIFDNHHVYVECAAWLTGHELKVKVSGHGDVSPKGFTRLYRYSIDGGIASLKRSASPK
jgi:hypothetical protein